MPPTQPSVDGAIGAGNRGDGARAWRAGLVEPVLSEGPVLPETRGPAVAQLARCACPRTGPPTRNAIRALTEDVGRNAIAKVIPIARALLTAVGGAEHFALPPAPLQR